MIGCASLTWTHHLHFSFRYPPLSHSAFHQKKHVYKAVWRYSGVEVKPDDCKQHCESKEVSFARSSSWSTLPLSHLRNIDLKTSQKKPRTQINACILSVLHLYTLIHSDFENAFIEHLLTPDVLRVLGMRKGTALTSSSPFRSLHDQTAKRVAQATASKYVTS